MQDNNCSLRAFVDKGVNLYSYANSGKFAAVWENESTGTNIKDIIMRKLDISGNPVNSNYYIVNQNTGDDQIIPSVSGLINGNHDILYALFDHANDEIIYKHSDILGSSVRKGKDNFDNTNVVIYPNPAKDFVFINSEAEQGKYYISDAGGRLILYGNFTNKNNKIELSSIPSGVYFLIIKTAFNTKNYKLFIN